MYNPNEALSLISRGICIRSYQEGMFRIICEGISRAVSILLQSMLDR